MAGSSSSAESAMKEKMLLNGPAGKPPPGVAPDFTHPQNLDAMVWGTVSLMLLMTVIAGSLRIYTKAAIIRSFAYEDYTVILAWMGEIAYVALAIKFVKSGGGKHMWDIQLKSLFNVLYWTNIAGIVYCITIFLVKLSILLQFLRVFVPNRKANLKLFVAIQIVIWSNLIFYIIILFLQIFSCTPRQRIWNPLVSGHCIDTNASDLATGTFNVVSDVSILLLPVVSITRLQMPLRRKALIAAVFATGIFACVTSILRTYYNWKVLHSQDQSYDLVTFGLWTEAEIVVGFLISCFPIMPKFFQHVGPKVYGAISQRLRSMTMSSHERIQTNENDRRTSSRRPKHELGGNEGDLRDGKELDGFSHPLTVRRSDSLVLGDIIKQADGEDPHRKMSKESLSDQGADEVEKKEHAASMV